VSRIVREVLFAGVIGFLVAASPFTGESWGPASAVGVAVAGGVFGYRWRRGLGAEAESRFDARALPLPVGVALLAFAFFFLPNLIWLVESWTGSVWSNNHGVFMPFAAGYVAYQRLHADRRRAPEASAAGLPLLALGGLVAWADQYLQTGYLATLGLILSLPGLSLGFLGTRRTRLLAPAFVLALMMLPIPNAIAGELHLRHMTAGAVEWLLHVIGIPVARTNTVLQTARNVFVVSNDCSGVSTLYASLAVAAFLSSLSAFSWRNAALLFAAVPMALAANVARVFSLVILTQALGVWVIDSPLHPGSGVAAFLIVVVGLAALSRLLAPPAAARAT
jgi:exosortase